MFQTIRNLPVYVFGISIALTTATELNECGRTYDANLGAIVKMTYDIFRKSPGFGLIWVAAVPNLEDARTRILSLLLSNPGDYFVYDLRRAQIVLQSRVSV